jgi:peptidoglycan/LPS O-acetylase OafA/YrhL
MTSLRRSPAGWQAVDAAAVEAAVGSSRIGGLDFLRAIAVFFVVWGHAVEDRVRVLAGLSATGVKLFFVLSGFLITRLLFDEFDAHGRIDFIGFYRRRIARLMPAFYLFLAVGIATALLRHHPVSWAAVLSSMLYVVNYYQALTGAKGNLVAHCWSLSVEEQFYLLWPLLASFLLRRRANVAKALLLIILAVWCWRWFLLAFTDASIHYLYRALETRADELAAGCLLAQVVRIPAWRTRLAAVLRVPGIGLAMIAAILGLCEAESLSTVFRYGVVLVVELPIIALLVLLTVVASTREGFLARMLRNRLVVHIGQVSYGIYLYHGLVGYTVHRVVAQVSGSFWLGFVFNFAAVVAVASASFRWFETPMRRWISGTSARR